MARQIVTQQAVKEAAEALVAEQNEPSIVAVQQRIGGGSYSTVKRALDIWKQERAKEEDAAPHTPAEVQAKGQEFARAVWTLASREAQREVLLAKNEAQVALTGLRGELSNANAEIVRLEALEATQTAVIEKQLFQMREIELSLTEAQTNARRVPELEASLTEIRAELDAARKEIMAKAVEVGRLSGEGEALRNQVRELLAAIEPKQAK